MAGCSVEFRNDAEGNERAVPAGRFIKLPQYVENSAFRIKNEAMKTQNASTSADHQLIERDLVMYRCVCMLMLVGLFMGSGCDQKPAANTPGKVTAEDVRHDASQAAETAAEYSRQTKDEFQNKLETRLKELDAEIAKLQERGSDLKDQAKADWDRKLVDLETKRDAARGKLAEVRDSSSEAWKDVRTGAQSAWDELDKAFREAAREF